jgi:hypothetical protein
MINPHNIIRVLILNLIIFSGCIATRNIKKENSVPMTEFSKTNFDGIYSNKIENLHFEKFGLWNLLIRSYSSKADTIITDNNMLVKLKMANENLVNVQLIRNDSTISEFNLRGKIDGEYFSVKRKYFLLPIPALLLHFETKNLIGNSKDGNLVIMHGHYREAWILIMAGGAGGISQNQFRKEKN